jgi:major membrane immunogen (membrane-anchored lipoprotein)
VVTDSAGDLPTEESPHAFVPLAGLAGVVLTAVLLTGCGSDDDTGSTRPATTTTSATSPASSNPADSPTNQSGTTIDVTIAGGRVTPDPSRKVEVSTG